MTYQPDLTRQQFDQFNAQSPLSGYGIAAYEWIPRVTLSDVPLLTRQAVDAGIFDFRFSRVGESPVFFPIYYSASAQMNGLSLGINLAATPAIRNTMMTSRNIDRLQLVMSENMGFDEATTPEVRLILPVFHLNEQGQPGAAIRGFVSAMIHFDEAMQVLLGPVLSQQQNLGLNLYRQSDVGAELLFTSLRPHQRKSSDLVQARTISFYQSYGNWTLKYQFIDLNPASPWWSLSRSALITIGLALISLLFLVLLRYTLYRRAQAEALAREQARSLEAAQNEYHSLFEKVVEGVYSATLDGRYLKVNPALARAFGYQNPAEMQLAINHIGQQLHRDQQSYQAFLKHLLEHKEVYNYEWEGQDRDGNTIWLSENAYLSASDEGAVYKGTLDVITERKFNEQQLNYQANHDPLTGLLNRTACQALLERRLKQRQWGQVWFIDLDGFKKINDTYGHGVGDLFLKTIADRLRLILRSQDNIARIGGDEFVLCLEGDMNSAAVQQLADRLQSEVTMPVCLDGSPVPLKVSASIGVTRLGPHYHQACDILRDADMAMYEVKKNGKASHQIFSPELHHLVQQQNEFEQQLENALKGEEFFLTYQPVVCLKDRQVRGFEVLLRWQNEQLGLVSPERFIPLAEQKHLIQPIGRWVIKEALHRLAGIRQSLDDNSLYLNINLSPIQLHDDQLLKWLPDIIRETGISPSSVRFELTESALDADETVISSHLVALRKLGFRLYIDDFGTGYSSLKRLVEFPVDGVKIDRSFVHHMETDRNKQAMIEVIINMARLLNLHVVAEGVETEAQRLLLQEEGCRYAQGYLFARPLPEQDLRSLAGIPSEQGNWTLQAT
nr:EAL domain-containing protein [Oceanospirillum sediminis]